MSWRDPSPANPEISLIRPLLDLSKEQLRSAARRAGLPFREDRSNRNPRILRNRIRHQLLPELEHKYSPAIRVLLRRTASIVGAEADFVSRSAATWLEARRREPFDALHPAVQRALLRLQLWRLGHEPGYERIESLRESGQVQEIAPGVRVARGPDGIVHRVDSAPLPQFRGEGREIHLETAGGLISSNGLRIEYSFRKGGQKSPGFQPGREWFSASAVGRTVILRHWTPGDRFQPLGMPKPAKLQDLFTNRKIPRDRRRSLAVATTRAGEIFWVEGFPPGESFKMGPRTRRVLVWKWRSPA
jgi:tRNA(Ile)-lysidine synthase